MEFAAQYTSMFIDVLLFNIFPVFIGLVVTFIPALFLAGLVAFVFMKGKSNERTFYLIFFCVAMLMSPVGLHTFNAMNGMHSDRDKTKQELIENPQISSQLRIERYIVVNRNPPKHFYVTLKNVTTNAVYDHVYVSKHCNNHAQIKDGEQVNIPVFDTWRKNSPEQKTVHFQDLYKVFCE
jgi:hypothetical protein